MLVVTIDDNTGAHIALGGGGGMQVVNNTMYMEHQRIKAGLLLDTLHGPHSSEFYGANFNGNLVGRMAHQI
jgi:hypothetical protein